MDTTYTTIAMLVILVLLVREFRRGSRIAAANPEIEVAPHQRFRTIRLQLLEPVLALVVVGSILLTDIERQPIHLIVALVGGGAGYAFGWYRARSTYVASYPAHSGIVLRYSVESFIALGLLIVIKLVAERDLLPEGEVFRVIVAALLGFILVESVARVITLVRYYRRASAELPA